MSADLKETIEEVAPGAGQEFLMFIVGIANCFEPQDRPDDWSPLVKNVWRRYSAAKATGRRMKYGNGRRLVAADLAPGGLFGDPA